VSEIIPAGEIISVGLGARAYDIHVGIGLEPAALLKPLARGVVPVVTDEHVAELHLQPLLKGMSRAGVKARSIVLPPGEASKSFAGLERLTGELLDMGVDRGGMIVALGGGVIGDLTGFAAGVLKRGVGFAQIPTTLLAQVDSSVGGKTAINARQGKNLIGLFHQPRIVIADVALLSTLPRREMLAGYAEVAKYGALGDADFFDWLEQSAAAALTGDWAALTHAVAQSCRMKAAIVARDERESGERALLNLGHTFGHALEAATGFSDRLLHGEAVAIGMALAFRLSAALKLCPAADAERISRHLKAVGLPSAICDISGPRPSAAELLGHMAHDKKAAEGELTFILARGIGRAFITRDVPIEAVRDILAA
jgi:3-dehydroquinate synthase